MHKPMLLLLAASLLIGCATAGGCELVALKTYSPEFNQRLADEVGAASLDAAWPQAVTDYVGLRDAVRACRGDK